MLSPSMATFASIVTKETWSFSRESRRNPQSKILLCLLALSPVALCLFSFNHLVRPRQHIGRNRQADLLGRLQIDDELELLGLFHGQVGGLGAF